MTEVLLPSWRTYPVPPANLTFDDSEGLVARMIRDILDQYSSRKEREMYRAWRLDYGMLVFLLGRSTLR